MPEYQESLDNSDAYNSGASTANLPRTALAAAMLEYTYVPTVGGISFTTAVPYSFGGWRPDVITANGVIGWDCSGAEGYVALKHFGILPPGVPASWASNMPYHPGPASDYLAWSQLWTVGSETSMQKILPGDYLCWPTHVATALSPTKMVSALNPEYGTLVTPIKGFGPSDTFTIRRMTWSTYKKGLSNA